MISQSEIRKLRKGAHLARPRRRAKRLVVAALIVILMLATAAVAVVFSQARSANDVITAKAVGNMNIGDLATAGVFVADLSNLQPGFTVTECFNSVVSNQQPGDINRAYAHTASGGLAGMLTLQISRHNNPPPVAGGGAAPGHRSCEPAGPAWTVMYSGTLANFLATKGSFANGMPGHAGGVSHWRWTLELPAGVDGGALAGQTATLAVNFENQTAD